MKRRQVIASTLAAIASAGCIENADIETQNMAEELNLTDVQTTSIEDGYMNDQEVARAVDKEAGLVYITAHVGSQGTSLQVVPLDQTDL